MEEYDSLPLSYLHEPYLTIDVYFEWLIIGIGGYVTVGLEFYE